MPTPRMCEPCTPDALLEAVRRLRGADPDLGLKPLLVKLRKQQPNLGAGNKEVREALMVLKAEKAESKATEAAAAPPAADVSCAPSGVALSLACFGCARLPSDMDDERKKHPVCPKCVKLKVPTTYWCCINCPGNPGAWKLHRVYHKKVKTQWEKNEDGGVGRRHACEVAEQGAREAAESGDTYEELIAEGLRYASKEDMRRAARTYREAIALRPDKPTAYYNLGVELSNSQHTVEAAQQFLEAKERSPVGSEHWAKATVAAFNKLVTDECAEVAKPEWWNDKELKALSVRVVRKMPNDEAANHMRAAVLSGACGGWEEGPRSAEELKEAAMHYERAAALCPAPEPKAELTRFVDMCLHEAAVQEEVLSGAHVIRIDEFGQVLPGQVDPFGQVLTAAHQAEADLIRMTRRA